MSFRQRLATHRAALVLRGAQLRGVLATDLASVRTRVDTAARIASILPLAKPLLSLWWRWRRR